MKFLNPLISGVLLRRYKRFLADVQLEDGIEVTAHCANPGSMLGLKDPGLKVWLEPSSDPKRKLKYSWRILQLPSGAKVGIDTSLPNKIVAEALQKKTITELAAYDTAKAEVKYGAASRVDFLLNSPGLPDCYLEVKSVTLSRQTGLAEFPDSVTARGAKHLDELATMVKAGHRAVMLFVVQRDDCTHMTLAKDLDPHYETRLSAALSAGVEVLVYDCTLDKTGISLASRVKFTPHGRSQI